MEAVPFRSGWVTFAAIVGGVVGMYHVLTGIAAVAEDDATERLAEVLYGIDISAWGWTWLVIGLVQLVTAYLVYQRSKVGRILGVVWAFITASLSAMMIFVAPIWALIVMLLSIAILYALITNTEEFGRA